MIGRAPQELSCDDGERSSACGKLPSLGLGTGIGQVGREHDQLHDAPARPAALPEPEGAGGSGTSAAVLGDGVPWPESYCRTSGSPSTPAARAMARMCPRAKKSPPQAVKSSSSIPRMVVSLMPRPAYGAVAVTDSFSPGALIGNAHQAPASGCQPAITGVVSRPARCRVSAATRTRPLWHPQAPPPRSEPGSPARARARPWPSGGGHRARRRRFPSGSGDRRPQAGPVPVSCSLAPALGRRARTSPMAGSWLAGSGSGRCAWIW
jgi:hypothetical protein